MPQDALLATKLDIPAARPNLVARARLLAQLDEGLRLGRRLTLVSAPPGFGKTTLIREWDGAAGRSVAWLSLDAGDNDPARFVRYLVAALARVDERLAQTLPQPEVGLSPQETLVAVINALDESGLDLLLALDDYHVISDFAVHDLAAFLLENRPANLHVVIGAREDPPLPLARLRARDQVTEIRERALRFTPAEAAVFFNQTMNLGLSAEAIAALAARTEGWVTGLQLAGLALRQQGAADEFVAAFAGDDRYIVDYLVAEVLDRAPDAVRDFLRRTAILDRLSAPLCDALTGRDDSQAMLEYLDSANLFLVPLDNRREWYRYHILFADVLRLQLIEGERAELHQKAGAWFEEHGLSEFAQYHTRQIAALRPVAPPPARRRAEALAEPLSEREIEVLGLIAAGCSNAEIAARLYITIGTVKTHINNIYGKLEVESRTQAVAKARGIGLIR